MIHFKYQSVITECLNQISKGDVSFYVISNY